MSQNKIADIVHHLLSIETWKEKVFPLLIEDLAVHDNVRAYFMMYHEATAVNLLELILYQKEAVETLGETQIDLIDYCMRKIHLLNTWYLLILIGRNDVDKEEKKDKKSSVKDALDASSQFADLVKTQREMDFTVAVNSLSILRYITDAILTAPLSVMTRLLNDHDVICNLVYVIEKAPWLKSQKKENKFEKFEDGRWKVVSKDEVMLLGKVEAQVWLSLYNLLLEPECQKKYNYNMHNHAVVLRVCLTFNYLSYVHI
jgi:hypothetical protein